MAGGNVSDLASACKLLSSCTISGVIFYPQKHLGVCCSPHIMMCSHASAHMLPSTSVPIFISLRSTYPLRIYSALTPINSPSHPRLHQFGKVLQVLEKGLGELE